jgi:hypothetical protein
MKPGKWPPNPEAWHKLLTPGEWDKLLDWLRKQIKD